MVYLLLERNKFKVYGPIPIDNVKPAERFFKARGFKVRLIPGMPSKEELAEWEKNNFGRTSDGCFTHGWKSCEHGHRAWLAITKNMISS